jgi:hypothetical protein
MVLSSGAEKGPVYGIKAVHKLELRCSDVNTGAAS